MKLKTGMEIVSLEQQLGSVRLLAPFSAADIAASQQLADKLADPAVASQWGLKTQGTNKNDNFNFQNINDVRPRDEDYISVNFRALSKTIVPGHWIDWSKDNVLRDSVAKLFGATVYPNHDFTDINNWLGSVNSAVWDEDGAQTGGIPGINAQYKIDALMNPRIARGLLMTPPAIHSTSMTVLFKFEFSHPDIATESRYRFYELLGEEVEGQIVRFIVTDILEYWEASLVFQGADRLAKQQSDDEYEESFSAAAAQALPANSNEEKTMKLSNEQKTSLGIEFDGEDVPESEVLKAAESLADKLAAVDQTNIAELTKRAEAGDKLIDEKRTEVTRLAKVVELGAEEGDLDPVIAEQISEAGVDRLQQLGAYYQKKIGDKFPETGRSSQEDASAVETAGGVTQKQPAPKRSAKLY